MTTSIVFIMGVLVGICIGIVADMLYTVALARRSRLQISDWVPRKPPLKRPF